MLARLGQKFALLPKSINKKIVNYSARSFQQISKKDDKAPASEKLDAVAPQENADYGVQAKEPQLQFSKAPIINNFGELPFGEIPEPLKRVRPFEMTTLSNGIKVCTESWPSPISAVGVFVNAGSRNESIETSGVAHFLEHLHFKGTQSRTRVQLETEIENLGAHLNAYTSREHTLYHMQVFNNDMPRAIEILGDIMLKSLYNKNQIEAERETIIQELEETNKDQMETLMENVYFNIYREHMMGQPILGDRDNINQISADMIKEFHATNYIGQNLVIVGTGNVKHQEFVDMCEKSFGNAPKNAPAGLIRKNTERPIFTPAMLFVRDDEMVNSNVGVFYDAPSWHHEDYYAFLLLQRIMGSYRIDKNAQHLNTTHKQYCSMHALLGDLVDVTKQECIYSPYSDCGIFGNYFFGNEVFTRQMNYCGMLLNTVYGHYMNEVEIYRARNKLYNELMQIETCSDVLQSIGTQILYLNRRVPRSEIAKRVAHIDANHMKHLCYEYFYDGEPSITNWGPIEGVSAYGSYKYFKTCTMSSVTNAHHVLYY